MYAENLKKIRKELGCTADKMADVLGVKPRTYGSWERGEKTPSVELCTLLCKKLNINLNWFAADMGEMFINKITPKEKNGGEFEEIKDKILIEVKKMLISEGLIK